MKIARTWIDCTDPECKDGRDLRTGEVCETCDGFERLARCADLSCEDVLSERFVKRGDLHCAGHVVAGCGLPCCEAARRARAVVAEYAAEKAVAS